MKNNLKEIGERFSELKSDLLHSAYTGDMIDNHIMDQISEELLLELGKIEKSDEVKRALINMFFLGQVSMGK